MVTFSAENVIALLIFGVFALPPPMRAARSGLWLLWTSYAACYTAALFLRSSFATQRVSSVLLIAPYSWLVAACDHRDMYALGALGGGLLSGSHFSVLDTFPWATSFSLNPLMMRHWAFAQWSAFVCLMVYTAVLVAVHVRHTQHVLMYVCVYTSLTVCFVVVTATTRTLVSFFFFLPMIIVFLFCFATTGKCRSRKQC